jgi:hypothetical protein
MNNKHSNNKKKYQQFTDDKDFYADVEEENEVDDDKIYKIENKIHATIIIKKHNSKKNKKKSKNKTKSRTKEKSTKKINNSFDKKINKNIKEKNYIESNISNSLISENSYSKSQKSQPISHNPNPISLEINIDSEMKKKIDMNEKKKNLSLLISDSNSKLKQKQENLLDITYNTTNSSQLDNSEFLLNKLKGNKLLQETKLKEAIKNKFSYYGKELNSEPNEKNNKIDNNMVFNIIDNKNNIKEKLNKSNKNKDEKKKYLKRKYINRKVSELYLRYIFNCNCKCYCSRRCQRNWRFNTISLIRNIFIFLVITSAVIFYSIIFFYGK